MARRRFNRAVSRRNKNQVWTVSIVDDTTVAAAATAVLASIVAESDWETSTASAEKATCLRIRGWLSMRQGTVAGAGSSGGVFLYIVKQDDDAVFPAASSASTYAEEDILWLGGWSVGTLGDTTARTLVQDMIIDVKAMRRIRTGQNIALVASNTSGGDIVFEGVLRGLVRMGGS